jgi:tRNA threonylcarbamoyl adenosine modification protein (Sua5/YciO/YrdC/YwlC family)
MMEIITLNETNHDAARNRALLSILQGEIIIVAAEHGYLLLCDAFRFSSVSTIHSLRQDSPGTAAQVMVGKVATLAGIAKDFDASWQSITKSFWPGMLTIQCAPQSGLQWDLGDGNRLGEFAVRIPEAPFLLSLLEKSGPVAVASASFAGRSPVCAINDIPFLLDRVDGESEISLIIDQGVLPTGSPTTVLRRQTIGAEDGIVLIREGAISVAELKVVYPDILISNP